ncbi:MAG: hypothetical protein J5858_16545 [Lentisphaeria bacterium]|nr:hypothetical protein [Lentisphaeria bacterium]
MKLSLMIQVYNGGDYWRECWESAVRNLDLFEKIYVSIGKSPKQEEDAALIRNFSSDKLYWICQDREMSAREHGEIFDNWVSSLHPEGHIFILCHDDILLRDGLLKLRDLELKEEDAAFGSFHFFFQEGCGKEITVREFHREDDRPLDKEMFVFLQDQERFTYNASGLVLPAELYKEYPLPWHLLRYGCFSECSHLIHPKIKRIYQTAVPTVKIRCHAGSEGALMKPDDLLHDSLAYHLISSAVAEKPYLRKLQTRSVLYLLRQDPWNGFRYFIQLQIKLSRLKFYYQRGWRIYGYMFQITGQKVFNGLAKLFRLD